MKREERNRKFFDQSLEQGFKVHILQIDQGERGPLNFSNGAAILQVNRKSLLIIINIFRIMIKSRKKVSICGKNLTRAVVVQQETDEFQKQKIVPLYSASSRKLKTHSFKNSNPYQQIKEIPQVQLTKEDMGGDPVELISKLQRKYKEYGAVKIKACAEWQPPFSFRYTQKGITTRVQKIHKLKQGKAFQQKYEQYNIKTFTSFAQEFEKNYKFKHQRLGSTAQAQLQYEYWNIVNGNNSQPTQNPDQFKVTIQYAADLPAHHYGSGFPTFATPKTVDPNFDYASSNFNLNNIYKAPTSVLKMSQQNNEKISGITIPWVYMGMLFSTFCWHVEDLWLNSLNYSHKGSTKTWYIIPESDKDAFDQYILKKIGHRQFLNSITFMIDPLQLVQNGIQVYKAYQRPNQYILTLFNAYHAGFSQGFNIGQAVNVVTMDSFTVIKKALIKNSLIKHSKPPVVCYDWMVSKNLDNKNVNQEYIKAQYIRMTARQLHQMKNLLQMQKIRRIEMIESSQKYDKNSCYTCKCYQYLSVLKCEGCDRKYCLQHATKCCGKPFAFFTRHPDSFRIKTIEYIKNHLT